MQKSNKTAMMLAWGFFKGNYALNFGAIGILALLYIFGMIPVIGMLFIFAYQIATLSIQIYFSRAVRSVNSVEQIEQIAAKTRIGEFFTQYLQEAAGGFLALFLISLLFVMLFGVSIASSSNFDVEQLQNGAMVQASIQSMVFTSIPSMVLLLIVMVLFYFFPAVLGLIMRAEGFNEAFKRGFLLFSPTLWKKCFNKEYFILIFVWSLILMAAAFIVLFLSLTIVLLPLLLIFIYILSLYNAAVYTFAADIVEAAE